MQSKELLEAESFIPCDPRSKRRRRVERLAWGALLLVTAWSRLFDLGERSFGHDESLHAYYSWVLAESGRYQHDPMLHGPLLFHLQAGIFRLLGDSDFTARLWPALSGIAVVFLPWFFRRELGPRRALAVGFCLLLSPALGFYSRYLRNDIWCVGTTVLWLRALLNFREQGDFRSLYLLAAAFAGHVAAKETAFLVGAVFGFGCVLMAVLERRREPLGARRWAWLAAIQLHWVTPYLPGGFAALIDEASLRTHSPGKPTLLLISAGLVWLGSGLFLLTGAWRRRVDRLTGTYGIGLGLAVWGVLLTLYTSGGRNLNGVSTGVLGSLGYWLAQHDVGRGGQPVWFYGLLAAIYEPLALFGAGLSLAWLLRPQKWISGGASRRSRFRIVITVLTAGSWILFSWAGERMPWLLVHLVVPAVFLAVAAIPGRVLRAFNGVHGGRVLLSAIAAAGALLLAVRSLEPLPGSLPSWLRWGMCLSLASLATVLLFGRKPPVWPRRSMRMATLIISIFLVLQARSLLLVLGTHAEDARELLFYAHGTSSLGPVTAEMRLARQRSAEVGTPWLVAHSQAVAWPLSWYLRREANLERFDRVSSWIPQNLPQALILGLEEELELQPEVVTRLLVDSTRIPFPLVSWPPDAYRAWSLKRPDQILNRSTGAGLFRYWLLRDSSVFGATQAQERWAVLYLRSPAVAAEKPRPERVGSAPSPQS